MSANSFKEFESNDEPKPAEQTLAGWVSGHVLNPFVNGTGAIQVINGAAQVLDKSAENPLELLPTAEDRDTFGWAVETVSSAAGAIIPYTIAGKFMHGALRTAGNALELRGATARVLANESFSQVLGAATFDFAKAPDTARGETRIGNALGSGAGFTGFMLGNSVLSKLTPAITDAAVRIGTTWSGRVGVGMLGGLASYETSTRVAKAQGMDVAATDEGRKTAMTSGGFINWGLPLGHKAVSNISAQLGLSVPVGRYIESRGFTDPELLSHARENPLAGVKELSGPDAFARADLQKNLIFVRESKAQFDATEEMTHLLVGQRQQAGYIRIKEVAKTDLPEAQRQFLEARAQAEVEAQQVRSRAEARAGDMTAQNKSIDATTIGERIAGNGKPYKANWAVEWTQMLTQPRFLPRFDYAAGDPIVSSPVPVEAKIAATSNALYAVPAESTGVAVEVKPPASQEKGSEAQSEDSAADKAVLGTPAKLGAEWSPEGVNFGIVSTRATNVDLLLFDKPTDKTPSQTLPLFKTDHVWHRFVPGLPEGASYLYRFHGAYTPEVNGDRFNPNKVILDPRGKAFTGETVESTAFGYDMTDPKDPNRHLKPSTVDNVSDSPKAIVVRDDTFDWQGTKHVDVPMQDSIIYEVQPHAFSAGADELGDLKGTYRGFIEKAKYLRNELGLKVTSIEEMPSQESDYDHWNHYDPLTGKKLGDYWNYNTTGYFAPKSRYSYDGRFGEQVNEFKEKVRELRKNNLEVIADVVFNHTREGNQFGPTLNFRGIDNSAYYLLQPGHPENYIDHTGCGNTLNCNQPIVKDMIVDSLKYWHEKMGVAGFRFDLATIFKYDVDNKQYDKTPIMKAIEEDPVLSKLKLIAEPWGPDNYYLGHFSDAIWSEWNGSFRDVVRKFVKGDGGQVSVLADRVVGSPSWFDQSKGRYSVNFVTAHDGFTMYDLVSYNEKHNNSNGENNNDGSNDNYSWNHGIEGPVRFDLGRALGRTLRLFEPYSTIDRATVFGVNGVDLVPLQVYERGAITASKSTKILPDSLDQSRGNGLAAVPAVPRAASHAGGIPNLKPLTFDVPMRVENFSSGMGILRMELSGPIQDGYREAIVAVARQGAHAIEMSKQIESIPADKRAEVEQLRKQQMKNMKGLLMMSRGVPMMLYGDEVQRTQFGNNNSWCQEVLNMYDWEQVKDNPDMIRWDRMLIDLRNEFKVGRSPIDRTWHGVKPNSPDWSDNSHFFAFEMAPVEDSGKRMFAAWNSWSEPLALTLPEGNWRRRADSSLPSGQDIVESKDATTFSDKTPYSVNPRSMVIFEADAK